MTAARIILTYPLSLFHRKKDWVFERLFQDSKEKEERMEVLKCSLRNLETFHWEEVLSILHLYTSILKIILPLIIKFYLS